MVAEGSSPKAAPKIDENPAGPADLTAPGRAFSAPPWNMSHRRIPQAAGNRGSSIDKRELPPEEVRRSFCTPDHAPGAATAAAEVIGPAGHATSAHSPGHRFRTNRGTRDLSRAQLGLSSPRCSPATTASPGRRLPACGTDDPPRHPEGRPGTVIPTSGSGYGSIVRAALLSRVVVTRHDQPLVCSPRCLPGLSRRSMWNHRVSCNVATMLPLLVVGVSFCNCDRGQSLPQGFQGLTHLYSKARNCCRST